MQDGRCWALTMWEPTTDGKGCGLWPTPAASEARQGLQIRRKGKKGSQESLTTAVRTWPTPRQFMHKDAKADRGKGNLGEVVGGQLNPPWVELLMGWPKDWTCLNPISMIDFQKWLRGFKDENEKNGTQEMSMVRQGYDTEAISRQAGRLHGLDEAEILLPVVCEQQENTNETRLQLESKKASKRPLRGLPYDEKTSCSPSERGYDEQRTREHPDALHPLPQIPARYGREAWLDGSWELGIARIAVGIKERVNRLKAIGNGQVPQCAATAWEILKP